MTSQQSTIPAVTAEIVNGFGVGSGAGFDAFALFGVSSITATSGADDIAMRTTTDVVIEGLGGNDTLSGGLGNDTIFAGAGDDLVNIRGGNDFVDTGGGVDTVAFNGVFADYTRQIDANTGNLIVTDTNLMDGDDGQVTIAGAATLQFADTTVTGNSTPGLSAPAEIQVDENQVNVTDFNAVDDIDSEGSGLTYTLGGTDAASFTLDATTGVLAFSAAPDFEAPGDTNADNRYELAVTVTDSGGLSSTSTVAVVVGDVVENTAPTLSAPAEVSVVENTTLVTDFNAVDDIDSEGSGLTYTLGGADAASFTLDATTGVLAFAAAPDFEAPGDTNADNRYELAVTVTDSGGLSSTSTVAVVVGDVVENTAPTLSAPAEVSVVENTTLVTDLKRR